MDKGGERGTRPDEEGGKGDSAGSRVCDENMTAEDYRKVQYAVSRKVPFLSLWRSW